MLSEEKTSIGVRLRNFHFCMSPRLRATLFCLLIFGLPTPVLSQHQPRSIGGGFYQLRLPTAHAALESDKSLQISVVGKLPVTGTLEIIARDTNEVSVDIRSAFRADDAEQANETMSTSGARLLPTDDGLHLKIRIDPSVWSVFEVDKLSLEMSVTVPISTAINIDAPYMQVTSEGAVSDLTIDETYESVNINGARGTIRVDSHNKPIILSDILGGFDLRTSSGKIALNDIRIARDTARGKKYPVSRARNEDGEIIIRRYTGPLQVRTARADIVGSDVAVSGGRNWIENSGGTIDVSFSGVAQDSRLDIRNSYEDILLGFSRDVSAAFSLVTSEGKSIDIDKLPHRIIDVRENRIDAECGAGAAIIAVRAKYGGSIQISGKP